MNNLNSYLSNIQFLNVCHNLSAFGIFFIRIDLMTIDAQNQSIPVINALFEYLGKSPDGSEAKNRLLQKVLIEFNAIREENKTLDMKYVNETYQYIVATLFDHKNITGYLIRMDQTEKVKSGFQTNFQKLLKVRYQNLLEYHIRNVCSTRNRFTKLSPLAIKKILDYIVPFIEKTGISEENKFLLKRFRRMSPEDMDINSNNQTQTSKALESLLFGEGQLQTGSESSQDELEIFKDLVNFIISDEGNGAELNGTDDFGLLDHKRELNVLPPYKKEDNLSENILFEFANSDEGKITELSNSDDVVSLDERIGLSSNFNKENVEFSFNNLNATGLPSNLEVDNGQDNIADFLNFTHCNEENKECLLNILDGTQGIDLLDNEREFIGFPSDQEVDNRSDNIDSINYLSSKKENDSKLLSNTLIDAENIEALVNEELFSLESRTQGSLESQETIQKTPGAVTLTPKKHKLDHDKNIPVKNQRVDNRNNSPIINLNLADDDSILSSKPGTSKEARAFMNYLYQGSTINNGKSKRLQYIEKAAKFITSCKPHKTFDEAVNFLKGYLLKLEKSTTSVPTYDNFAHDYCHNFDKLVNYDMWQIPKHKFIEDVLFETYFDHIRTFEEVEMKMSSALLTNIKKVVPNDFKIYKNSPILQESLRIQDFLLLKLVLQNEISVKFNHTKKVVKAAFYRLALKECEEDWVENNITLFGVQNGRFIFRLNFNKNNYTFTHLIELSKNREEEEKKLRGPIAKKTELVEYKIEFENQAGIVNVDRIFGENTTERFAIPLDTTISLTSTRREFIGNKKILLFKLKDKRLKETKMIDMVKKLHNILTDPSENLFAHYN